MWPVCRRRLAGPSVATPLRVGFPPPPSGFAGAARAAHTHRAAIAARASGPGRAFPRRRAQ
eukprot:4877975-Lingulodinium_polyedra.AAC.1